MPKKYDFNAYLAEAQPTPFVLEFAPGDSIEIQPPDVETTLKLDEARTARRVLELLCGEHYTRVHAAIAGKSFTVLNALVDDIRRHFNLELGGAAGGTPASST